jgi:DUF1680 family protein
MDFSLFIRIPEWCRKVEVLVNDKPIIGQIKTGKYLEIRRTWQQEDKINLRFLMPVERLISHPYVTANTGRSAIKRGPIIYCAEQADNPSFDVWNALLPLDSRLEAHWQPDLLGGIVIIEAKAHAIESKESKLGLYRLASPTSVMTRPIKLKVIPYYAWANRKKGPMIVWLRYC